MQPFLSQWAVRQEGGQVATTWMVSVSASVEEGFMRATVQRWKMGETRVTETGYITARVDDEHTEIYEVLDRALSRSAADLPINPDPEVLPFGQ